MEEFCRRKLIIFFPSFKAKINFSTAVTNIPLETTRQDGAADTSRPPWIRPVRKKTSSITRSSHSGDSPSHHSSPEAFSPSEFFNDPPKNGIGFSSSSPSTSRSSSSNPNQVMTPPQYSNGTSQVQHPSPTAYMDTSGGLGMDVIREDTQMYMSPGEMMALFSDGNLDVGNLFPSEFIQQQQNDRQSGGNVAGTPVTAGFSSPVFLKMNGLVPSP